MMTINLDELSLPQLKTLRRDIEKAIESFETRRLQAARSVLEAKAAELGVSLTEIMALGSKPQRQRPSGPARFRNPENSDQTWSGRGRKPAWFAAALARGVSQDKLMV